MTNLSVTGLIMGAIGLVIGAVMFWRLPITATGKLASKGKRLPYVSIIIPARNEAQRIRPLLASLQQQNYQHFEVLVVDDHSTDQTVQTVRSYNRRVISRQEDDNSGAGKSSACWYGAQQAKGEWLLFLDADTCLASPDSLEHLLRAYEQRGSAGILSIQPYHTVVRLYEHLSAIFNVMVVAGMNVFTVFGPRLQTAGAFGPCLLSNREDYFLTGGHQGIQEAVMDDLALGQSYLGKGLPVHCLGGKHTISFRMYPEGMKSLIEGWCKSFALGSQSTHPLVLLMSIVWISGSFVSATAWLTALFGGHALSVISTTVIYVLYVCQTMQFARRCGNFRWPFFVVYPLLFLFFTAVFVYSLFRVHVLRSVHWRNRKIDL